jgi:N6-adenosine-specific RNA methylase IME4
LYADPPWKYSDKRHGRGGVSYKTMTDAQIRGLQVQRIVADHCALFLWTTKPFMPVALSVMRAWGFEFKTIAFDWVKRGESGKLAWGNGAWTRANAEHVLLGVRGKPRRVSAAVHSVIEAPRGEHSAKPAEVRDRIVKLMGDVPRLELFARVASPGWYRWGDRAPKGDGHLPLTALKP